MTDPGSGLQVIDISTLTTPFLVGGCKLPGSATGVTVYGSLAYVAALRAGLQVVDVSSPVAPVLVAGCEAAGDVRGVVAGDTHVYVTDYSLGLRAVSLYGSVEPDLVGSCDVPVSYVGRHVAVFGSYACVRDLSAVRVVDISNPASPMLVGNCALPDETVRVVVSGGRTSRTPSVDSRSSGCGRVPDRPATASGHAIAPRPRPSYTQFHANPLHGGHAHWQSW